MSTSQTSSLLVKKKESIIEERIFVRSMVMEKINLEWKDEVEMELVGSRVKQQGLYGLASHHVDLYGDHIVEEFYLDASFKYSSQRRGEISDIMAKVQGIEISLNRELLEDIYRLPSGGLKMGELETFGSKNLLTAYWKLSTGDETAINVHLYCQKKNFTLPHVYLHDFCCRIVEKPDMSIRDVHEHPL